MMQNWPNTRDGDFSLHNMYAVSLNLRLSYVLKMWTDLLRGHHTLLRNWVVIKVVFGFVKKHVVRHGQSRRDLPFSTWERYFWATRVSQIKKCMAMPRLSVNQGSESRHQEREVSLELDQGLPFRFFYESHRLPETKFGPKFRRNSLIPNGKELQIQKKKFRWIPTEISVISTEIRWFSTGKLCNLCFSYCSRGQMKNFWIPTLFSFSRSTTFVLRTFSFEQWFESYLIISKTTN